MKTNIIETPLRIYWTTEFKIEPLGISLFKAEYQAKNKKTGKPWQASRYIRGSDVACYWARDKDERIVATVLPVDAPRAEGAYAWCSYFSTKEKAIVAIQSKKQELEG